MEKRFFWGVFFYWFRVSFLSLSFVAKESNQRKASTSNALQFLILLVIMMDVRLVPVDALVLSRSDRRFTRGFPGAGPSADGLIALSFSLLSFVAKESNKERPAQQMRYSRLFG